jgi:glucose-1-phosphate adenylyltransferase
VLIQKGATVKDSLITDGCVVSARARVEKSILSPGVFVGPDAVIRESVILTDTFVDAGARIERAIVDKGVRIGRKARVGKSAKGEKPTEGHGITTIGKNAEIPDGVTVKRGTVIHTDVTAEHFTPAAVRKRAAARRKEAAGT